MLFQLFKLKRPIFILLCFELGWYPSSGGCGRSSRRWLRWRSRTSSTSGRDPPPCPPARRGSNPCPALQLGRVLLTISLSLCLSPSFYLSLFLSVSLFLSICLSEKKTLWYMFINCVVRCCFKTVKNYHKTSLLKYHAKSTNWRSPLWNSDDPIGIQTTRTCGVYGKD